LSETGSNKAYLLAMHRDIQDWRMSPKVTLPFLATLHDTRLMLSKVRVPVLCRPPIVN